jgi:hypothetical protein
MMLLPLRTRSPRASTEIPAVPRRTISPRRPIRPWPAAFSLWTRPAALMPLRTRPARSTRTRPTAIPSTRSPAAIPRTTPRTAIVLPALTPQYLRRNFAPHHFSRLFPRQIIHPVRPELEILQLRQINGVGLAHDGNQLDNFGWDTSPRTQGARWYRKPLLNQSQLSPIRRTPGRLCTCRQRTLTASRFHADHASASSDVPAARGRPHGPPPKARSAFLHQGPRGGRSDG